MPVPVVVKPAGAAERFARGFPNAAPTARRDSAIREGVVTPSGPLREILALNTDLLLNALDDMSDAQARERVRAANPVAFLAAHVVDARCFLAALLGMPVPNPIGDLLKDARSADDVEARNLPTLDTVRAEWTRVSAHLERTFDTVTDEQWRATIDQRFPVRDRSLAAGLAFLLQHESYHVGQMALLRRQLGCPALTYRRRGEESA